MAEIIYLLVPCSGSTKSSDFIILISFHKSSLPIGVHPLWPCHFQLYRILPDLLSIVFSRFPLFVALQMIYHLNHMNKIEKVCGSAGNVLPPKGVDGHGSVCSWGEA